MSDPNEQKLKEIRDLVASRSGSDWVPKHRLREILEGRIKHTHTEEGLTLGDPHPIVKCLLHGNPVVLIEADPPRWGCKKCLGESQ